MTDCTKTNTAGNEGCTLEEGHGGPCTWWEEEQIEKKRFGFIVEKHFDGFIKALQSNTERTPDGPVVIVDSLNVSVSDEQETLDFHPTETQLGERLRWMLERCKADGFVTASEVERVLEEDPPKAFLNRYFRGIPVARGQMAPETTPVKWILELKAEAIRLVALLDDPHPGLGTWVMMLGDKIRKIRELTKDEG